MEISFLKKSIIPFIAVFLLITSAIQADVPRLINYQGYLTDDTGEPIPDGGNTGNSSVMLPDDAIDDTEILNEAGIVSEVYDTCVSFFSTSEMVDVITIAGTYNFRLESMELYLNSVMAEVKICNRGITAIYYPTSYGNVAAVVNSTAAGQFEAANPVETHSGDNISRVVRRIASRSI